MDLYVDTADLDLIREYAGCGVVDGITTNPSIVAPTARTYQEVIESISELIDGSVFAQVLADDVEGMVAQARAYDGLGRRRGGEDSDNAGGYEALGRVRTEGIRAGVTVLFSVLQAVLAAKNDATLVAPTSVG